MTAALASAPTRVLPACHGSCLWLCPVPSLGLLPSAAASGSCYPHPSSQLAAISAGAGEGEGCSCPRSLSETHTDCCLQDDGGGCSTRGQLNSPWNFEGLFCEVLSTSEDGGSLLSSHSFLISTITTNTTSTPSSATDLFLGWCHKVHAPHPIPQHSLDMMQKPPLLTHPHHQGRAHSLCQPHWGRKSLGLRGGTTLPRALGSGGKVPGQRSMKSHLGFASRGKSMVCKMSKVGLRAGAKPGDQGTRSTPTSALGTSVKSKEVFAVASLLSCVSHCLPHPTEHMGLTSGDSCPKHFSSCEKGPPERLGKYLLLPAVNTSAVNCKVSLVPLQAA